MQTPFFHSVVNHLTGDQTPRVWSLLVTIFGELAQTKEARITGSLLRALSDLIGIKPEAMRVAIHRLRKEGWIDSERSGRHSSYFLTKWGREQSAMASPRIYADGPSTTAVWLVMCNPGQPAQIEDETAAWITSNVFLTSRRPVSSDLVVSEITTDTPLPDWMTSKVCEEATVHVTQRLAGTLETLGSRLESGPSMTLLETAALRILLVHSWRRIVLTLPELPDYVFPEGWEGPLCRSRVAALLTKYPKRTLKELEAAVTADTDDTTSKPRQTAAKG